MTYDSFRVIWQSCSAWRNNSVYMRNSVKCTQEIFFSLTDIKFLLISKIIKATQDHVKRSNLHVLEIILIGHPS